jgi:acyl-CoA synthetase (NDP forming)
VGVIGGGGGPSDIAAEECEESGLEVIPIPEDMRREIKKRGVSIWDWISNPVDLSIIGGSGISDTEMLHLMGCHPDFDILLANFNEWVIMTLASNERFRGMMNQVENHIKVRNSHPKPFAVIFGERGVSADRYDDWHWKLIAEARGELIKAGVATYPTFRRAARALFKVREYYARRE